MDVRKVTSSVWVWNALCPITLLFVIVGGTDTPRLTVEEANHIINFIDLNEKTVGRTTLCSMNRNPVPPGENVTDWRVHSSYCHPEDGPAAVGSFCDKVDISEAYSNAMYIQDNACHPPLVCKDDNSHPNDISCVESLMRKIWAFHQRSSTKSNTFCSDTINLSSAPAGTNKVSVKYENLLGGRARTVSDSEIIIDGVDRCDDQAITTQECNIMRFDKYLQVCAEAESTDMLIKGLITLSVMAVSG